MRLRLTRAERIPAGLQRARRGRFGDDDGDRVRSRRVVAVARKDDEATGEEDFPQLRLHGEMKSSLLWPCQGVSDKRARANLALTESDVCSIIRRPQPVGHRDRGFPVGVDVSGEAERYASDAGGDRPDLRHTPRVKACCKKHADEAVGAGGSCSPSHSETKPHAFNELFGKRAFAGGNADPALRVSSPLVPFHG